MKLTSLIVLIALGTWHQGAAQSKSIGHAMVQDSSSLIEQKLVELALTSPKYLIVNNEIVKNKLQVKKAKNSWFDLLNLSMNYNDQTFSKKDQTATNTYVYPKYFFGLTLPIGMFFSKGAEIKTAKENVKISEHNKEEVARAIRVDILSKYKTYKTQSQMITLQSSLLDDEQAMNMQAEKLFTDGKITLESYSNASKAYVTSQANILNLQLEQEILKLEIESIIGMSLESAISQAITPATPKK